jgi:lipopolysaccharide/colanic/teichoic acid biosynthesis glycosyltransferase
VCRGYNTLALEPSPDRETRTQPSSSLQAGVLARVHYLENWSIWFDVSSLAKTIPAMLRGTGAH